MTEAERDLATLPIRKKRRVWKAFMEKHKCYRIAEIGVGDGTNFLNMIAHEPGVAVAVDTWLVPFGRTRNAGGLTQKELTDQLCRFKEATFDKDFVRCYRASSAHATKRFPDGFFDLVYLDADPTKDGCRATIEDWYPKVRSGGFLLGDDYRHCTWPSGTVCGVIEAVNEFAQKNGLRVVEMPRYGWGVVKR